jgi:hypothetical protein
VSSIIKSVLHRVSETAEFARCIFDNRVVFDDSDRIQIAILIQGGIGDVMIAARWLRRVIPKIGSGGDFALDIYYATPQNVEFIFGNFESVRYIYDSITFHRASNFYNLALIINHLGFLEARKIRAEEIGSNRALLNLVTSWIDGINAYRRFSQGNYRPPRVSAELAEFIRRRGFNRSNILQDQTGIDAPCWPFPFMLPSGDALAQYPQLRERYITVHDGWDAQLKIGGRRPTKCYPIEKWRSLVRKIKAELSDIVVVQLGGDVGAQIPEVDLSLKGVVGLPWAVKVLQNSLLHIDTDSGLVHVAVSLGKKAVVLFGPTGIDFYGYPQNANVQASGCTNCWLSTGDWVTTCLIGDRQPRCMSHIPEELVLEAVAEAVTKSQPNLSDSFVNRCG